MYLWCANVSVIWYMQLFHICLYALNFPCCERTRAFFRPFVTDRETTTVCFIYFFHVFCRFFSIHALFRSLLIFICALFLLHFFDVTTTIPIEIKRKMECIPSCGSHRTFQRGEWNNIFLSQYSIDFIILYLN